VRSIPNGVNSSLRSSTLAFSDGFLCYLCYGISLRWSGFPGNPDPPALYTSDDRMSTVLVTDDPSRECTKYSTRIV